MAEDERVPCQLYLISPPEIEPIGFGDSLKQAISGGPDIVGAFQLRLKDVSDDDVLRAADILMPICAKHGIPFLVNDRPDLAAASGADGVHIGQSDASYDEARAILGDQETIGVTCHDSRHLAMTAGEKGADYVAFGAFFPTTTKDAKYHPDPEILEWCSTMTVLPCVAIGGINQENCTPLIEAGADFLAVVSAVWNFPAGPEAAVAAFAKKFEAQDTP
jgi:thiamine-phosphate pyrophosphorylase